MIKHQKRGLYGKKKVRNQNKTKVVFVLVTIKVLYTQWNRTNSVYVAKFRLMVTANSSYALNFVDAEGQPGNGNVRYRTISVAR